ncbi:hypothetical protein CHS0354_003848 [Potamilus streckersoni]|uniref:Uncharacterized protein n=1 Tax=Potamilus streckersoni TaxID=2493646 RepID=A0AAE0SFQ2_9BIVA|nr:hypothetical protein CHS0354_003848 [Potamilus streckersoni]
MTPRSLFEGLGCIPGEGVDPWELVFRITPEVGGDPYDAWISGGTNTTNFDVNCQTIKSNPSCTRHFRSALLQRWSEEVTSKVKVGIYKDGKEVHNITFNATGSNLTSWFSKERVLNTTYRGILTNNEFNYFCLKGYVLHPVFSL